MDLNRGGEHPEAKEPQGSRARAPRSSAQLQERLSLFALGLARARSKAAILSLQHTEHPMSLSSGNNPQPRSEGPTPEEETKATGRYRFRDGEPVDPDEGVHPEMRADGATARERPINQSANNDAEAIPASPAQLIAMQNEASKPRPEKPERQTSANVTQVMELIDKLDTKAAEDLEIAYRLVRRLESFHDEVVDDMRDDPEASHNQLISWAIDADRLMQARILLGNVDLE